MPKDPKREALLILRRAYNKRKEAALAEDAAVALCRAEGATWREIAVEVEMFPSNAVAKYRPRLEVQETRTVTVKPRPPDRRRKPPS
jgi:hypothetical protein